MAVHFPQDAANFAEHATCLSLSDFYKLHAKTWCFLHKQKSPGHGFMHGDCAGAWHHCNPSHACWITSIRAVGWPKHDLLCAGGCRPEMATHKTLSKWPGSFCIWCWLRGYLVKSRTYHNFCRVSRPKFPLLYPETKA